MVTSLGGSSSEILLHIGGIDGSGDHVLWSVPRVVLGDVITVRNGEGELADRPASRIPAGISYRAFLWHFAREKARIAARALLQNPIAELVAVRDAAARTPARMLRRLRWQHEPARQTMIAVSVNGQRVCSAAVPGHGNLTASLTWVGRAARPAPPTRLSVHGLDATAREHRDWAMPHLESGDEVGLRVAEADDIDPPTRVRPQPA